MNTVWTYVALICAIIFLGWQNRTTHEALVRSETQVNALSAQIEATQKGLALVNASLTQLASARQAQQVLTKETERVILSTPITVDFVRSPVFAVYDGLRLDEATAGPAPLSEFLLPMREGAPLFDGEDRSGVLAAARGRAQGWGRLSFGRGRGTRPLNAKRAA